MGIKLKVEKASFSYNEREDVFQNVSFSVSCGEVFFILGPNGTGKSTLLKTIAGLLPLKEGEISIDGTNIKTLSPDKRAKKIGYLPQLHHPVFPFRSIDVVLMGRTPYLSAFSSPTEKDTDIAYEYMEKLGISHLANKPYTEISGGERQLVLLARVLTQQPETLLLDEPTSHLDFGNQIRILTKIRELSKEGFTVIITSHFPDNAFFISHKVGILNKGKLVTIGSPDNVITEEMLKNIYGIDVKIIYLNSSINRKVCIPMVSQIS